MTWSSEVCVDAGLAVKMVVDEPDTELVEKLFAAWVSSGTYMIAPVFFEVEAESILRKKVAVRKELSNSDADGAVLDLRALPIEAVAVAGQRQRAREIAREFGLPTVYDATYLALADLRGCEFWTADERLFNSVKERLTVVPLLRNAAP